MNNFVKVRQISGKYSFRTPGVHGAIRKRPGDEYIIPLSTAMKFSDTMEIIDRNPELSPPNTVLQGASKEPEKVSGASKYRELNRKELGVICKKRKIPVKGTNVEIMAALDAWDVANPGRQEPTELDTPRDLGHGKYELGDGSLFDGSYEEALEAEKALK